MTLRRKLLLVALSTLALPWAGWLYVRQMEHLLRNSQEQALLAIAFALDRGLVAVGAELPNTAQNWYVQRATQPLVIDGSDRDWASLARWTQHPWPEVTVQLANDPGTLGGDVGRRIEAIARRHGLNAPLFVLRVFVAAAGSASAAAFARAASRAGASPVSPAAATASAFLASASSEEDVMTRP